MSRKVIAKRYARALFKLADEAKALEEVGAGLGRLAEAYGVSPDLQRVIADTQVPHEAKSRVLGALFAEYKVHELVNRFTRFVQSKRRLSLLPDIHETYLALVGERMGRVDAEVTVSGGLSDDALRGIREKLAALTGKEVNVEVKVDPAILGGVVTKIGSTIIDGSLRNQLTRVYQSIIRG